MADAGDGVEDCNFEAAVANSSILRLFTLKEWIEEVLHDDALRKDAGDGFWDKLFENEMNVLVHEAREHYAAYVQSPKSIEMIANNPPGRTISSPSNPLCTTLPAPATFTAKPQPPQASA
jgi:leucyl-tRNA synthetase